MSKATCVHFWDILPADYEGDNPQMSLGTCNRCGDTRMFENSIDYSTEVAQGNRKLFAGNQDKSGLMPTPLNF